MWIIAFKEENRMAKKKTETIVKDGVEYEAVSSECFCYRKVKR